MLAAVAAAAAVGVQVLVRGAGGLFNDFYDYWGAAALLGQGASPYDLGALAEMQRSAGLHPELGGGYSYPLLFAQLLRPLALLRPGPAATLFALLSLVALALAVGLLLGAVRPLSWPEALGGGLLGGLFAPITGSLYFGQANLLLLAVLAVAYRGVAAEALVAVSAAVKLYPATGLLVPLAQGRRGALRALAGLILLGALLLIPQLGHGGRDFGSLLPELVRPDTYWSNQSINGWLSRLALPSKEMRPPLPGLPVEAAMLALGFLVLAVTMAILLAVRGEPQDGGLALAIWAGLVVAPKNSLWNFAPLLLCLSFAWPRVRSRPRVLIALAIGVLLIEAQAAINLARDWIYQPSPALTWLSSMGLYGALLIGSVVAFLVADVREAEAATRPRSGRRRPVPPRG